RMGSAVRCLPAFVLTVEHPTTIGLGDTFVGGFIAALAQRQHRGSARAVSAARREPSPAAPT
ncbi:MAG TPA: hypothetical protein DCP11_04040, partial [Microbacteriaceae bacterium]|nr:hypothetical protein [Microbacteriaceae bacterium]